MFWMNSRQSDKPHVGFSIVSSLYKYVIAVVIVRCKEAVEICHKITGINDARKKHITTSEERKLFGGIIVSGVFLWPPKSISGSGR
jgi:hypothetical protein